MNRRALFLLTAALACAGPGPGAVAPGGGGLAHRLPSESRATYTVVDTVVIAAGSEQSSTEMTAATTAALTMRFERDRGGVRVNAEIADFGGSVGNPAMGRRTLDSRDARGPLIFVVGRTGTIVPVARPEMSPDAGQLSFFQQLPYDLFPGLPGRSVGPGDSWSDTTIWSSATGGIETTSVTARTYTLVGDTVVDGRSLVAITVAGEVAISSRGSQGGAAASTTITGTQEGHLLWDTAAGLLHMAEIMRRLEGESTMEGRAPGSIKFTGPQRLRREN